MTLTFSGTRWASVLSHLLDGVRTTGCIHRVCALPMIGLFLTHRVDVARRRKGTPWLECLLGVNTMVPTVKDVREFMGAAKWFLGRGERPKHRRWNCWEKFPMDTVIGTGRRSVGNSARTCPPSTRRSSRTERSSSTSWSRTSPS